MRKGADCKKSSPFRRRSRAPSRSTAVTTGSMYVLRKTGPRPTAHPAAWLGHGRVALRQAQRLGQRHRPERRRPGSRSCARRRTWRSARRKIPSSCRRSARRPTCRPPAVRGRRPPQASTSPAQLAAGGRAGDDGRPRRRTCRRSGFLDAGDGLLGLGHERRAFSRTTGRPACCTPSAPARRRAPAPAGRARRTSIFHEARRAGCSGLGRNRQGAALAKPVIRSTPGKYTVHARALGGLRSHRHPDRRRIRPALGGRGPQLRDEEGRRLAAWAKKCSATTSRSMVRPGRLRSRPGAVYSTDGLPTQKTMWIEKGVLRNLQCGRYWAQKSGRAPVPRSPTTLTMRRRDDLRWPT